VAGSVNKVILVGNVGKDPEIRFMPDGTKTASFSIATGESWKDKNTGERRDKTEWHRIAVINDRIADVVEKYVKKGSSLYVEGQLQSRKWTDQSGVEKIMTEIVISRFKGELTLLGSRSGDDAGGYDSDRAPAKAYAPAQSAPQQFDDLDDDVPF
jgi:single-strand DNA-binding protein